MNILHLLYQLLIEPLVLLMEVLFRLSLLLTGDNVALSIIPLSLAVNFLCLPLYLRADAIQQQNHELELKMRPWLSHIKKVFKGDERIMMMQTYYRICGYKPWFALRNAYSLLLQIPFFTAAYIMLSDTPYLNGVQMGPIADLGAPDALFSVGGLTLNLLPILMTAINVVSGIVYLREGTTSRSYKVQFYLLALIFLVLLYNSPAGLVFYWILNQLFSLGKNVVMVRIAHRRSAAAKPRAAKSGLWTKTKQAVSRLLLGTKNAAPDKSVFLMGCLTMVVLTGTLIPSALVDDSTVSFITDTDYYSPFKHILFATVLALGAFVVWPSVFYHLAGSRTKRLFEVLVWSFSLVMITNYMFFGRNLGNINPFLIFDDNPFLLWSSVIRNGLIGLALVVELFIVWQERRKLVKPFQAIVVIVLTGMFIINLWHISGNLRQAKNNAAEELAELPDFGFSRNGKNVVVVMLDRGINGFIPYIFNEKPELKEQFKGFTYYPNTTSFGAQTNSGAPALYGGYEYMPRLMDKRDTMLLKDKHDEALLLMPVLFSRAGYDVTVTDPPYAGYSESPDLSIYNDYPDIKVYKNLFKLVGDDEKANLWHRNFFRYSLTKVMPLCIQPWFYDKGFYQGTNPNRAVNTAQIMDSRSLARGTDAYFRRERTALLSLPGMSKCDDSDQNHFLLYYSCMAHSPTLLTEPDYEPATVVDNTVYDAAHEDRFTLNGRTAKMGNPKQMSHYHANMASMMKLGAWFEYLREQGVYDNTRIIIVSDHGTELNSFDDMHVGDSSLDLMCFHAMLLVKDFNGEGEICTDSTFMTNADTPTLAMKGLIKNPVNPFTGNTVTNEAKYDKDHFVFATNWRVWQNNGKKYQPGDWWILHGDNFFDTKSWQYLDRGLN